MNRIFVFALSIAFYFRSLSTRTRNYSKIVPFIYDFLNFDLDKFSFNTKGHSNKVCNYKVDYVMSMRDEFLDGKGLGVVKERLFKRMLDDAWVAAYRKNKALRMDDGEDSEVYWKQALDWAKYASDVELRLLKHVEGSKVEVSNKLDSMRGVIDVEVKDVESLEVDKL